MPFVAPSRRAVAWLGLVVLILYALWLGGPYLRSIVLRDAAVTAWLNVAAAPIDGDVRRPLRVGARVGADGRLLAVENPRADKMALDRARGDLERAQERVAAATRVTRDLETVAAQRAARAAEYAALFKRNLDTKIGGMKDYVEVTRQRIALERAEAERRKQLLAEGRETPSAADAAAARVQDLERQAIDMQTGLNRATQHRRAADAGVFFLDDGTDGAAEQRSLEEARVALERARSDLAVARRDLDAAQRVADDAQQLFDRLHVADVTAPAGAIVWSDAPPAGTAVRAGAPVAAWIDCRELLVDAPVSDVQLSLLRTGAPASIVLEGERRARTGKVLLLRGAAATLGASDLAAVAKGRRPGVAQVVIALDGAAADAESCPVGRAAFVHFPDVSVLDVVLARLRW
jgi:multidrug resistance efflux pump